MNSIEAHGVSSGPLGSIVEGGTLMRMRTLLPIIGLLALGACKDEKKAEKTNAANPPATSTPAPTAPAPAPGVPVTPAPTSKPAGQ